MKRRDIPEGIKDTLTWDATINKFRINATGQPVGYVDKDGYHKVSYNGSLYQVSRVLYFVTYGKQPDVIQYIDGDRSNVSLENIISVEPAQNLFIKKWKAETGYKSIKNITPVINRGKLSYQVKMRVEGVERSTTFIDLMDALSFVIRLLK